MVSVMIVPAFASDLFLLELSQSLRVSIVVINIVNFFKEHTLGFIDPLDYFDSITIMS